MHHGERFNGISHLVGAALSLAGMVVLAVLASMQGDPWKIVSFSVYGVTLFLLYTMSTLYHSLRGRARQIFMELDHVAIYLLIAGSYTPFTLVPLRGVWGWTLFIIIWGLAIFCVPGCCEPLSDAEKAASLAKHTAFYSFLDARQATRGSAGLNLFDQFRPVE